MTFPHLSIDKSRAIVDLARTRRALKLSAADRHLIPRRTGAASQIAITAIFTLSAIWSLLLGIVTPTAAANTGVISADIAITEASFFA